MNTKLNPYQIVWLALIPVSGIATKEDAQTASKKVSNYKGYFTRSKMAFFCFQPSETKANEILEKIKNSLSKTYKAYIFTDKQFGLSSKENADIFLDKNIGIKLTALQKSKVKSIK